MEEVDEVDRERCNTVARLPGQGVEQDLRLLIGWPPALDAPRRGVDKLPAAR
jgi:hypothetical protein